MLINEKTRQYICQHQYDDIRQLALQGVKDAEIDLSFALQQIAGRQTAHRKLPTWAAIDGVLYPPHLNMEQCSSEQTARYKAQVVGCGDNIVDLTGGFGVDFYWMSQGFRQRTYIEQNPELCALATHNFHQLDLSCEIVCRDAVDYLTQMAPVDVIYLDPARRNAHGGRTYSIKDCTPNVLTLLPLLRKKSRRVVLKLSPMLDWHQAVEALGDVSAVHIVSVDNECKELLMVLGEGRLKVYCVNNDDVFAYQPHSVQSNIPPIANARFLYVPHASIMKAGCFEEVAVRYALHPIAPNSHLFLSADEIDDFPGRGFRILDVSTLNKHLLQQHLSTLTSANIAVRNFPLTADQLRKKLKLKDGGDTYLFATTAANGEHLLYICRKIG